MYHAVTGGQLPCQVSWPAPHPIPPHHRTSPSSSEESLGRLREWFPLEAGLTCGQQVVYIGLGLSYIFTQHEWVSRVYLVAKYLGVQGRGGRGWIGMCVAGTPITTIKSVNGENQNKHTDWSPSCDWRPAAAWPDVTIRYRIIRKWYMIIRIWLSGTTTL